jgi:rhomboid family GlyGly-CTERM serine protease
MQFNKHDLSQEIPSADQCRTEDIPPKAHWALAIGLMAVMIALQWCGPAMYALLRYERELWRVEPWRVFSAHMVHLGAWHCALNVTGLLVWAFLFADQNWRLTLSVTFALCVATGAILPVFSEIEDYAGFSGVLYGLFSYSFTCAMCAGRRWLAWGLLGLMARIVWQWLAGPSIEEEALIGGTIVVQAHWAGVLAGCAFGLVMCRDLRQAMARKLLNHS